MAEPELISVVIPCYNPPDFLAETVGSVELQTHPNWEIIVVDDGSDDPLARARIDRLEQAGSGRLRVIRQENRGLAAARNTGIAAAAGRYIIPLDSDDLLEPDMMEVCLAEMEAHPEAAFAYFDYSVFGEKKYIERPGEYNFYRILQENYFAHCCFLRKQAWETCGGYDEWHRWGYEDWSFYLNLGKHDLFGRYIPRPLFKYRVHRRGLHYTGLEKHETNWARIKEQHPEIFSPEGRLRIKREWAPSICFIVQGPHAPTFENQSLRDFQVLRNVGEQEALARSRADAFLWLSGPRELTPQAAEECLWALQAADWVTWTDTGSAPPPTLRDFAGPLGLSREALASPEPKLSGEVRRLPWACRLATAKKRVAALLPAQLAEKSEPPQTENGETLAANLPAALERIHRHLVNADLLSWRTWTRHPLRSLSRLIPLRFKEAVNRLADRSIFDLSFYLQFQPRSVLIQGQLIELLDYIPLPPPTGKRRVAVVTPHLGYGGAETVLLELVRQFDREKFELSLLAPQGRDRHLLQDWLGAVDWVWDLSRVVDQETIRQSLYSMAVNWNWDLLVLQNAAAGYSILPQLESKIPDMRVIDILHVVDDDWDLFEATLEVADCIDKRIVISEAGRLRLEEMNTPEDKIRLIRNGVDLGRFYPQERPLRSRRSPYPHVGFIGKIEERKRPLLLPEVAAELRRLRKAEDFRFVIAGSGPEEQRLRSAIVSRGHQKIFRLLGHVRDMAEVLPEMDVLLLTSASEGIPLVVVEALAMEIPVVACRAGAIEEALPPECGVLVDPGPGEDTRLAEALQEILVDEKKRRRMGRAGRELVERDYSLESAREAYRRLIAECMGE